MTTLLGIAVCSYRYVVAALFAALLVGAFVVAPPAPHAYRALILPAASEPRGPELYEYDEPSPAPRREIVERSATQPRSSVATPPAADPSAGRAAVIVAAAAEFGADRDHLLATARCESGPKLNVNAIGDGGRSLGVLQIQAATFLWLSDLGALGYTLEDLGRVDAQARVAAWAFAHGQARLWTCSGI